MKEFFVEATEEEIWLLHRIMEFWDTHHAGPDGGPGVPIADAFEISLSSSGRYVRVESDATRDAICEFVQWFEAQKRSKRRSAGIISTDESHHEGLRYVLVRDSETAAAVQEFLGWYQPRSEEGAPIQ